MNWMDKNEELLLQRSFLFGITGIVLCLLALVNINLSLLNAPMGPLNGVGIALQFFGLSIAVLVLRKRKISDKAKEKAKKMILVLGVALIFFFMVI
ncbi:hypothetical protein A33Q_0333 [Indibacter alkaliphilus LW1]|jgi:O-antigen/teichoic acid export membrane protein|uniref:Uncharacterized protein n=1 Tax=Indibacter alkaliphilus (strain CCUG 57479 / KCTC 22604 / LW1) TaxID=1189612 RepID=S2DL38_INDAL|nr:hypothetical protein [Indibacter alkaliphilus]EOZ99652.1 hypothetical protein A33Q_0333 [Indibacter alkaliphilus LW1]